MSPKLFGWLRGALSRRPFVTNALLSGTLMCVGDRIAQAIQREGGSPAHAPSSIPPPPTPRHPSAASSSCESPHQALDASASWLRTAVLTTWSGCVNAPFYTWWYRFMHVRWPGRPFFWVLITAVLPAPALNAGFFTFSTVMEHLVMEREPLQKLDHLRAALKERMMVRLWPTVVRSAQVWSTVNILNFTLVPLDYRMLVGSAFALGWNVYLSLKQHEQAEAGTPDHHDVAFVDEIIQMPDDMSADTALQRSSGDDVLANESPSTARTCGNACSASRAATSAAASSGPSVV